jgi:hypothetical protein
LRTGRVSFSFVDPESVNSPDRILLFSSSWLLSGEAGGEGPPSCC